MFSLSVLCLDTLQALQQAYQAAALDVPRHEQAAAPGTHKSSKQLKDICMRDQLPPSAQQHAVVSALWQCTPAHPEYTRSATFPQPGSRVTRSASASDVSALCLLNSSLRSRCWMLFRKGTPLAV